MEKILIFIKHHFKFLWVCIEWINALLFSSLYKTRLDKVLKSSLEKIKNQQLIFRKLEFTDLDRLLNLFDSQPESDLDYFRPHAFDRASVERQFSNEAFLMMGVFDDNKIVGYFFLRFFANKKCFVGRLVDSKYRGKGIGAAMNAIMYETAWNMGFRCLSTISKNNSAVIAAHENNPSIKHIKALQNDYMLVEFVKTRT